MPAEFRVFVAKAYHMPLVLMMHGSGKFDSMTGPLSLRFSMLVS